MSSDIFFLRFTPPSSGEKQFSAVVFSTTRHAVLKANIAEQDLVAIRRSRNTHTVPVTVDMVLMDELNTMYIILVDITQTLCFNVCSSVSLRHKA